MAQQRNSNAEQSSKPVAGSREAAKPKRSGGGRQKSDERCQTTASGDELSAAELAVLGVFRKYLMTPGKMLCLSSSDLETFRRPLAQLTSNGLLVAERFRGGYSLTELGFAAMRGNNCSQTK